MLHLSIYSVVCHNGLVTQQIFGSVFLLTCHLNRLACCNVPLNQNYMRGQSLLLRLFHHDVEMVVNIRLFVDYDLFLKDEKGSLIVSIELEAKI